MTTVFVVKLVLTPLLIGLVTLAGRRWGPGVSGWLAGFPLTSAPVSIFLALEQGPRFAADAAAGTLLGLISMAVFCLVYGYTAPRTGWVGGVVLGLAAFAASTALLARVALPAVPAFTLASLCLAGIVVAMPASAATVRRLAAPPWDLPLRMATATGVVLALTGGAALLGPRLSGLLSPVPVFALVLAVFAHRAQGPAAAAVVLRGVVIGSFAFAAFFVVVGVGLVGLGMGATYLLAAVAALGVNGAALWLGRSLL